LGYISIREVCTQQTPHNPDDPNTFVIAAHGATGQLG
jgi:hypothetical protein